MQRSFLTRTLTVMSGVAAGLSLAACSTGGGSDEKGQGRLSAAGASFPAAIYQRWFQGLSPQGVKVNYQSVGSGAGVRQFTAETVDFGASDKPMKPEAIAKVSRGVVQIPMTAGAIAVAYNNPGCDLSLTQKQLAGIFLGQIMNYSELGCADKAINVVHRSDGSGTTYNFTKHLEAISPEWKQDVGADKSVKWPTGVGAKTLFISPELISNDDFQCWANRYWSNDMFYFARVHSKWRFPVLGQAALEQRYLLFREN